MKKIVPAMALILLTASIVFAATKVEYKDSENHHSEWKVYCPPAKAGMAQVKAGNPAIAQSQPVK